MNALFTCEHFETTRVLNPALKHQSLARALSADEATLAAALETAFADGAHDPAAIAAALQARGVRHLDGSTGAWTAANLTATLEALNASLDHAYADHGIGA